MSVCLHVKSGNVAVRMNGQKHFTKCLSWQDINVNTASYIISECNQMVNFIYIALLYNKNCFNAVLLFHFQKSVASSI